MKRLGLFLLLISAALVSLGSTPYDSPWRHYETFWRTADSTLIGPSGNDTIQSFPTGTTDTGTGWTYVSASGQWYYSKSAGQAGDVVVDIYETSGPDTLIAERYVIPGPVPGDSTVTGAAIQNDAIDSQHYADASIDSEFVAAGEIDSIHIAAGAIDSIHVTAGAIDSIQIVAGAVDSIHIVSASIDSVHIGTVPLNALSDWDVETYSDRAIMYYDNDSSSVEALAAGANGTYLKQVSSKVQSWDQLNLDEGDIADITLGSKVAGQVMILQSDGNWDNKSVAGNATLSEGGTLTIDESDDYDWTGTITNAGTVTFNEDVTINDVLYYSTDVARKYAWSGNVTSNVLYFPGAEYGDICVAHAIDVDDQIPAIRACECKTDSTTVYISVGTGADGDSLAVLLYKTP